MPGVGLTPQPLSGARVDVGATKREGLLVSLSANEIDAYVGRRMRERREALGISQGRLGRHLGLTFSQVQKYEKGSNRIGAGRLYQIAGFLGVSPNYFFEGLGAAGGATVEAPDDGETEATRAIGAAFAAIKDADARASVLALVKSLSDEGKSRNHCAR